MIKFQNVTKIYPSHHQGMENTVALDDVSFEIKEKEFVSIVGKSGAGKTTLLKLILAEERPSMGQIFFEDIEVNKLKPGLLPDFRRKIGAVFQDYKLLPSKTTYQNAAYIMEVIGASDREIKRDVPEVLKIVGLSERMNNHPIELSAGEKQRLSIARALVHRPKIILADEPTGNLDPYNTLDIIKLLLKIQELGTTVILSTHNKEVVNNLGKRVITMEKGKIIRDEENGRFVL